MFNNNQMDIIQETILQARDTSDIFFYTIVDLIGLLKPQL